MLTLRRAVSEGCTANKILTLKEKIMNIFLKAVQRINPSHPDEPKKCTSCNIPLRWWTKVKLPDPRLPSWATQQTELEATFVERNSRQKQNGVNRWNASLLAAFLLALSLPASAVALFLNHNS